MENAKAPFLKKEGFGLYQKLLGNMEIFHDGLHIGTENVMEYLCHMAENRKTAACPLPRGDASGLFPCK